MPSEHDTHICKDVLRVPWLPGELCQVPSHPLPGPTSRGTLYQGTPLATGTGLSNEGFSLGVCSPPRKKLAMMHFIRASRSYRVLPLEKQPAQEEVTFDCFRHDSKVICGPDNIFG